MKLHIIKLGGSVITGKDQIPSFDHENVSRIAKEIFPFYHNCILVHGTGNYGKPPAIKYGYYHSGFIEKENILIALKIRSSLLRLNQMMIDALISCDIPAYPLDMFSFYEEKNDQIDLNKLEKVLSGMLKKKILPVLHGDLICTHKGGFRVMSSDQITGLLSGIFHPDTVIFLSDVDGVYLSEPDCQLQNGYYLTDRLNEKNIHRLYHMDSDEKDVSGGMKRKTITALEISRSCKVCFIGSGYRNDIVGSVVKGASVKGTYVG